MRLPFWGYCRGCFSRWNLAVSPYEVMDCSTGPIGIAGAISRKSCVDAEPVAPTHQRDHLREPTTRMRESIAGRPSMIFLPSDALFLLSPLVGIAYLLCLAFAALGVISALDGRNMLGAIVLALVGGVPSGVLVWQFSGHSWFPSRSQACPPSWRL